MILIEELCGVALVEFTTYLKCQENSSLCWDFLEFVVDLL